MATFGVTARPVVLTELMILTRMWFDRFSARLISDLECASIDATLRSSFAPRRYSTRGLAIQLYTDQSIAIH